MRRLCRFFIILIVACTVASCFSPIGSIGGSDLVDFLWAEPNRLEYKAGDRFVPNYDLEVFASYQGVTKPIPLKEVEIGIAEDPNKPNALEGIPSDGYTLKNEGKKLVVIEYKGMDTAYSIKVSPASGTGGIDFVWE